MDEGAKIYTAMLSQALGAAGAAVRLVGFGRADTTPEGAGVQWIAVPGERRSVAVSVFSALPMAAAMNATPAYASILGDQLRDTWDAIVFDGYASGWALNRCLRACNPQGRGRPVLVHVSHNHEELVWRDLVRKAAEFIPRKFVLWQNYHKVRSLEHRLARHVDLLTTNSDEDRRSLGAHAGGKQSLTLTPGYTGWVADARTITTDTPRRAILIGSFRWVVKQENLARFVELADPIFRQHGIELDVIGDVPEPLLHRLQSCARATRFHGFVEDVSVLFDQARIAIVPEMIGGGFKHKFLHYFFGRLPVATIDAAAAGLHPAIGARCCVQRTCPPWWKRLWRTWMRSMISIACSSMR